MWHDAARLPVQLAGRWGKNEVRKCTVRKKIYIAGPTRATKAEQKLNEQNKPTPFICTHESPFATVSTVRKGHPSLVSPTPTYCMYTVQY